MERLGKLLFELSSNERMQILLGLQRQRLKLSQVSRNLYMTVTEASRHLQRLSEAGLIQKGVDGKYGITPYGELVLSQLSGLDFVSKHREYFMEYDLSCLPYQFVNRLGEVAEGVYVAEAFRNLAEGENRMREAQELIWILSDQVLASSIPLLAEKLKAPFDLRIVLPEGIFPSESKSRLPSKMPSVQKRVLPKVDVLVVMTEKYAVFCLPNRKGRIDYTGFKGEDPKFYQWCTDLFLYYWKKAEPFTP